MGQLISSAVEYETTSVDYGCLSYNNKTLNLKQTLTSAATTVPCYNTHTVWPLVKSASFETSKVSASIPEIPGVLHHADEVFVAVNRCADSHVVIYEIVPGHLQTSTTIYKFPRSYTRTKRYCSFVQYILRHYQDRLY